MILLVVHMVKTFKTQILPTAAQREYIEKAFGVRRWAWNWAVAKYEETRANEGKYLSRFELQKILNHGEAVDPAYSWLTDVNSMVRDEAIKDFSQAMKRFYEQQKAAKKKSSACSSQKFKPTFKKKGRCPDSFRMFNKR
jgi:putative transposase